MFDLEHQNHTDEELLKRLKEGDGPAFAFIYNRYFQRLYTHAFKILGEEELCKDIIQEVFVQLWNKRQTQEIRTLDAYLYAITRFQVFKALRSVRMHARAADLAEVIPGPYHTDSLVTEKDLHALISKGVEALPEKCRAVYQMSRVHRLSNAEIALKLSIAPKTVENQLTIALRKLRSTLKDFLLL